MNFSKFNYAYSRHGLIGFLNVLIGKIDPNIDLKHQ